MSKFALPCLNRLFEFHHCWLLAKHLKFWIDLWWWREMIKSCMVLLLVFQNILGFGFGHLFILLTEDPTEDIVRVRRGERPRRTIWSRGSVQLGTRSICSLHTAGTATGCKLMLKEGHYGVISATFWEDGNSWRIPMLRGFEKSGAKWTPWGWFWDNCKQDHVPCHRPSSWCSF